MKQYLLEDYNDCIIMRVLGDSDLDAQLQVLKHMLNFDSESNAELWSEIEKALDVKLTKIENLPIL